MLRVLAKTSLSVLMRAGGKLEMKKMLRSGGQCIGSFAGILALACVFLFHGEVKAANGEKRDGIQVVTAKSASQFQGRNIELELQATVLGSEAQFGAARKWIQKSLTEAENENPDVKVQIVLEDDFSSARVGYGDSELRKLARNLIPGGFPELDTVEKSVESSKDQVPSFFFRNERVLLSMVRFAVSGGAALWSLHLGVDAASTSEAVTISIPGAVSAGLMSGALSYENDWYLSKYLGGAKLKLWGVELGKLGRWYAAEVMFLTVAKIMGSLYGVSDHVSFLRSGLEVAATALVGMVGQGALEVLNEKRTAREFKQFWNDPNRVKLRSRLRGVVISGFAVLTTMTAISTDSIIGKLGLVAYSGYGGVRFLREWIKERKSISSCENVL